MSRSAPEPDGENTAEDGATNPFPLGALPRAVGDFCASVAVAHAIDPAFVAVPALAALAGAVAGTRRITIKSGTWAEPAHLWCGLIAPSGSGKSPAQNAVLEPLRRRDAELARRTKLDLETHKAAVAAWRSGGSQGPEPAAPAQRQALLDDCTLEAAMARLVDNPRGLLLAADELAALLRSFDKYRQGGGDLSRWLSIHTGGSIRVDRKGGGSAYLERAVVGVVGGIQPSVARELLGADTHSSSGFTARFLLAAPPTSAACWSDNEVDLIPSAAARRLRSGAYPFGSSPLGQEARAQLSTLAGQLDAIQRDERSSLAEKDAAAKRTVAAFRKRWAFTVQKADNEYRDVCFAAERLDEQVRALETKLSPFDVKRIERVAAALETMDPQERVADFRRALDTKDTSRLMAHGLLDSSGTGTKRALAALVDPQRFQFVLENGQAAAAHRSVAMAVDRAAAELEQLEDAWKEQRVAPRDLFDFANLGSRAVADVDADIGVLPAAFDGMLRPPQMMKPQPAPAPQQVEKPQPQAPVAGGAA